MVVKLDEDACLHCGSCVTACPNNAIEMVGDKIKINPNACTECGTCVNVCPQGALNLPSEG
jgi:ferredoxin